MRNTSDRLLIALARMSKSTTDSHEPLAHFSLRRACGQTSFVNFGFNRTCTAKQLFAIFKFIIIAIATA